MTKPANTTILARDIMQTDVLTVGPTDSLQEAMTILTENHVTGLPVIDNKSRCVGVVTAGDILNFEQEHSEFAQEANSDMARHFDPERQRWESVRLTAFALEEFAEIPVSEVMTRELVSVGPTATATEVAQLMLDKDIHRVLVLDAQQRLFGIIVAFDFVGLWAEFK